MAIMQMYEKKLQSYIARMGDIPYNTLFYYYLHLRCGVLPPFLSFARPVTFNDKIIYLKRNKIYADCQKYADKIAVRDYVADVLGDEYLVPLIAVWRNAKEISLEGMPDRFVMKMNHGSGMNIFCADKRTFDLERATLLLNKWANIDYFEIGKEWQYRGISPRIMAEEMLWPDDGSELKDFKIFCFHGEPRFIQVDINRYTNHTRNFYDLAWNKLPFTILYPSCACIVEKPKMLDDMLHAATKLSQPFIFARIDLYNTNNQVFFGEITFGQGGGFEPIKPRKYARILGEYIKLE